MKKLFLNSFTIGIMVGVALTGYLLYKAGEVEASDLTPIDEY